MTEETKEETKEERKEAIGAFLDEHQKAKKPETVEDKIKSGEWKTFELHFTAQMASFAVSHAVIVVAAPDYKGALAQFSYVINQDRKQLVALLNEDGTRDVAFVNLAHADFVALLPDNVEEGAGHKEKGSSGIVKMPEEKCEDCDKETCECQKSSDSEKN